MSDDDLPPAGPRLLVAGADAGLDALLTARLTEHNHAASGFSDQAEFTVRVEDSDGRVVAGLSGWTWGTTAGIALMWVRDDHRRTGWGRQMMEAAEQVARERGCHQVVTSSFTFQAPGFYERLGYVETGRTDGLPVVGMADVHLVKRLVAGGQV